VSLAGEASAPLSTPEARLLARFDLLFAQTTEPMLITNGRGRILDANTYLLEFVGLSREELLAADVACFLAGGEQENLSIRAERIAQGSVTGETTVVRPDGSRIPVRFWTIEVDAGGGVLRSYIGVTPTQRGLTARQTNSILRAHFDDAPDGKLVVDGSGNTIYANRRHLEYWGLDDEDIALPFDARWPKTRLRLKDPEQFLSMRESAATGRTDDFTTVMETVDGRVYEVRTMPLPDDHDLPAGRAYSTRDITEQEMARQRLRSLATLLSSVSTNSPEGILVVDLTGSVIHHNQRFLDMWGVDESWLELPLPERWPRLSGLFRDQDVFHAASRALVEIVLGYQAELALTDGRFLQLQTVGLQEPSGEVLGRAAFFRDVTAEREAEAVLRASEERYRTLVSSLATGVVMQYADGRIGACNAAAERILGLTESQILGLTSFDARWRSVKEDGSDFPVDEHPAVITLRTGEPCNDVVMGVYHANGSLRWLLVNSRPLQHGGASQGVVISFQDITEQRQAERALANARTAEAFQALASGVAHKINNALASIVGNAYLAGLAEDLPKATTESLHEIVSAASDSAALVRDLLALSGRAHNSLASVELGTVVESVLESLPPGERLRVETNLEQSPPAPLDQGAVAQAVNYILRNALEAGTAVHVSTLRLRDFEPSVSAVYAPVRPSPGDYLAIEVRDDGPGIADQIMSRLFEPFATTKFAGRGLGLAATAGIMGSQRGFVEVESSPAGCRVRLLLPAP